MKSKMSQRTKIPSTCCKGVLMTSFHTRHKIINIMPLELLPVTVIQNNSKQFKTAMTALALLTK